ncbi:MAG: Cell division protein FtsK [uncultured Sulfurovum sp.]|uniref:Cell division protein FtsK n=1 Tax=uncultured Sulfurovum sp. TaxID=269237 RepID=A0A6S6TSI8_9BACT|nr:MAG: Cell division protein FtsK [uncultured Sulfurovum sp.]
MSSLINIKVESLKITIIIIAIVLIYTIFSTYYHDTTLVGDFGKIIGGTNLELFGYVAYINIFILFIPLYKLYYRPETRKDIDFYLGWILLFIAIIIFSALTLNLENVGFVGREIVAFLQPLIGKAGLWLFWLMVSALSLVFIIDDDFVFSDYFHGLFSPVFSGVATFTQKIKSLFNYLIINPFSSPNLEQAANTNVRKKETLQTRHRKNTVSKETNAIGRGTKKVTKKITKKQSITPQEKAMLEELKARSSHVANADDPTTSAATKKNTNSSVKIVSELEENSKLMGEIEKGAVAKPKNFKLPKLDFLQKAPKVSKKVNEAEIDRKIEELLSKLQQFKVDGDVVRTYSGPLVTTFEFKPAPNVKVSKILNLQDDLAMALAAETIRIQAPIPGRDVVGIEIPNESIDTIYLREILESSVFQESSSPLTVALGKDIVGNPFVTDIKKLPHLLIAGTTGSGKSVGINAMILSLLYRNDPEHLKLMLIDPKMLEFAAYEDIPHLITPVITEPAKAIAALANMVGEMERRYKLMADARTKNIDNYNEKMKKTGEEAFPYIVVVIDELADLMMSGGKDVELSIARLAQKSRACGIHLVVATQRPSVDVVTGMIKANLPSRLSYRVGSRIDSKVILDAMGADSLLGRGDGLFTPPGSTGLVRIHAPWNTEGEIDEIVEYIKAQRVPEYDESYLVAGGAAAVANGGDAPIELDALYEDAKMVVLNDQKTSISYLQRKLQIGYNRSANIIEQLEAKGVLSAPNTKGNREIL